MASLPEFISQESRQLMIHFTPAPPFSLTCWCTFIAHWSAGAAAVHIGRFRGDTPRATASVIHVLICFSVHHAWGSLKGSWGSWWGWAGCHAANLGEIFISWSVANNLQQENRMGTFTPKARCQDQNHLSARLFLSCHSSWGIAGTCLWVEPMALWLGAWIFLHWELRALNLAHVSWYVNCDVLRGWEC